MSKIIGLNDQGKPAKADKPNLDLSKSTELVCKSCGHNVFIPGAMFRKISKLISQTPKDAIIPIEVYLCGDCGEIQEDLLPDELKLEKE
jgi:hypothetical protein